MRKIKEGMYECPSCKKCYCIGDLYLRKQPYKNGSYHPENYCNHCNKAKKTMARVKKQVQNSDQSQLNARRRLEELRELKETEW